MLKLLPTLFSIVCITVLTGLALGYGIDGALFATSLVAISGLGGYSIRQLSNYKNGKN